MALGCFADAIPVAFQSCIYCADVRTGLSFGHASTCPCNQARISPTFQAVTRSDSLMGFGNVPALTLRHKVGELNGKGAALFGLELL